MHRQWRSRSEANGRMRPYIRVLGTHPRCPCLDRPGLIGVIIVTHGQPLMAPPRRRDPKRETLREQGVLNPHPERVHDELFAQHDFFDARDLVQVKYEMVRRVQAEGMSVTDAATNFGFSRPSFYQAQESMRAKGLAGLLPKKRGPRSGHKLGNDVIAFLEKTR